MLLTDHILSWNSCYSLTHIRIHRTLTFFWIGLELPFLLSWSLESKYLSLSLALTHTWKITLVVVSVCLSMIRAWHQDVTSWRPLTTFGQEYWQGGHVVGGRINAQVFSYFDWLLISIYHHPYTSFMKTTCKSKAFYVLVLLQKVLLLFLQGANYMS